MTTWRTIPGVDPDYQASDDGRIRSRKKVRGKDVGWHDLKPVFEGEPRGYYVVNINRRAKRVHVLVSRAFFGLPADGQVVRHLDGDKLNNHLRNLAYGTASENQLDAVHHGQHGQARKTHCPRGHAYDEVNTYWYKDRPRRACRKCFVIKGREKRQRARASREMQAA